MTSYVTLSFRCLLHFFLLVLQSPSVYSTTIPPLEFIIAILFSPLSHHYFVPPLLATSFQVQKSLLSSLLEFPLFFHHFIFSLFPLVYCPPFL